MSLPEDSFSHILKCIPSGSDFETHTPLLFSWLSQNSKSFTDKFLKDILLILEDAQYPPSSKFYCALLLLKSTEVSPTLLPSRLSKQRHLLDKMFKDAQFDKQKEFEQRGRKFFSRNPTEEQKVLGINYIRLILEAIVYWYKSFGSGNTRDPLYIFTLMYNNLSTLVTLPAVFYYAGREFYTPPRLHLQHFMTLTDDPIALENNTKRSAEEAEEEVDRDQIFNDVVACISSLTNFKANSSVPFQGVGKNSWAYNKVLLRTITSILTGFGYPPEFKFYALLLVVRLSETQNEIFIQHIGEEKTLLENVLKFAQFEKEKSSLERGKTFFKSNPSPREAITGKNFVSLSREAVYFWAVLAEQLSHTISREGLARLRSSCVALVSKLDLTGDYAFIGSTLEEDMDPSLRKFSEDATRSSRDNKTSKTGVIRDATPVSTTRRDESQKYARRAEEHLRACIASEDEYREMSLVIFNSLQKNPEEYGRAFLKNLGQVLNCPDKSTREKYYALYVLVRMTQMEEDNILLSQLEESQNLLDIIFFHAEEELKQIHNSSKRGYSASQAPQETEEDLVVYGLRRLACEAVTWWNSKYAENPKSKFNMRYQAITQDNGELLQDLIYIDEKADMTPLEALKKYAQVKAQKLREEQHSLIEGLKTKLERLADVKESFKKTLEENEEAIFRNMRVVDSMMKDFTQVYHKEVLLNANLLIDNKVRGSEKFVHKAVLEGDIFEKVSKAYLDYKQQILKYPWFRAEVIRILSDEGFNLSAYMSQGTEMSRVEAQEALDKIMEGKERIEEAMSVNAIMVVEDQNSVVMPQEEVRHEESQCETQTYRDERTPVNVVVEKEREDIESAWVYEGDMSSKREISSILNADEDKGTPSTPKKQQTGYSPASDLYFRETQSNVENSDRSVKRYVSTWTIKTNNVEGSEQKNQRTMTSVDKERTSTEEQDEEDEDEEEEEEEEEQSMVDQSVSYEALVVENKRLLREKQQLYEENCELKRHIEENKEQMRLDEASQALEGMREILLEAQKEMEGLYKELHVKSEENRQWKKKYEKKDQELRTYKENAELRFKIDGLSLEMNELKRCIVNKSVGPVRNQNEELETRLKDLEEKNSKLTKTLEDMQEKNSMMCSKMQELEELQTIVTSHRQNTSRLAGPEFMFETKTTQYRENITEGDENHVDSAPVDEVKSVRGKETPKEAGSKLELVESHTLKDLDENAQENENLSEQKYRSPVSKRKQSGQSPLRMRSGNVIQDENVENKEQFSRDSSPNGKTTFNFPKRYFSLQVSKCFLPEQSEEHDLSSLSVDLNNYPPHNTNVTGVEGLGLNNIINKNLH